MIGSMLPASLVRKRDFGYDCVMRTAGLFACVGLAISANCQPSAPDNAEQQAILSRIREGAISYADRLQDFTCIEITVRSAGGLGAHTHWKRLEQQELELTYVAHREGLKLLKVNGKPATAGKIKKGAYFSPGGEFGSYFRKVFDPKAQAEFDWDHEEALLGRRTCVFRYRVPRSTSTWSVTANADEIVMGHHGVVHADRQTGAVMRLQLETEISDGKPVGIQADVHYGLVEIAGQEFLLPQTVEEIARYHGTLTKVEMEFRDYRKYSSDSTITFK